MTSEKKLLDDLRGEIDQIDAEVHRLYRRRVEVVEEIAALKNSAGTGGATIRPGREAEILRRLIVRHQGPLPVEAIVRIWREMISAVVALQGPFSVVVYGGDDLLYFWDLARAHYGSTTPMIHSPEGPAHVLHLVGEQPGAVGVLPAPGDIRTGAPAGESDAWWVALLLGDVRLKIFARLPFVLRDGESRERDHALVVGPVEREQTGDDITLLAIETAGEVSPSRFDGWLAGAGLEATRLDTHYPTRDAPRRYYLYAAHDYVATGDNRLALLRAAAGEEILNVNILGGYAAPVVLARPKSDHGE